MNSMNSVAVIALNEPLEADPFWPEDPPQLDDGAIIKESILIVTRTIRYTSNNSRRVFYQPPSSKYDSH